jgi:transcriptional regulator with XRE-family HTH domain
MPEKICDTCDQIQRITNLVSSKDASELYDRLRLEIIDQRCRLRWSQNKLAQMSKVSRSTLGSYERGEVISLLNFLKITQTLYLYSAWGSFIYNAAFNPHEQHVSLSTNLIQTRPTRPASKKRESSF